MFPILVKKNDSKISCINARITCINAANTRSIKWVDILLLIDETNEVSRNYQWVEKIHYAPPETDLANDDPADET